MLEKEHKKGREREGMSAVTIGHLPTHLTLPHDHLSFKSYAIVPGRPRTA